MGDRSPAVETLDQPLLLTHIPSLESLTCSKLPLPPISTLQYCTQSVHVHAPMPLSHVNVWIGACKLPPEGISLDHQYYTLFNRCADRGKSFKQTYDGTAASCTRVGRGFVFLCALPSNNQIKKKSYFLIGQRNKTVRKLSASDWIPPKPQPTQAALSSLHLHFQ